MKKYLVLTMSKTTNEVRKEYVEDTEPHGTRIEEYIDSIISQVGDVWWATFEPEISEETAECAFLNYTERRRSCVCY